MVTREFLATKIPLDAWQRRLRAKWYSEQECRLALRGEEIPLCLGHPTIQACIVRGIRAHDGFAHELRGLNPLFTRALNARTIMSNAVPQDMTPEETPYCIWYPDTASEATYRELVRQYPHLKYHVARACAVAGYSTLYHELDILSEIHIAEEARDNGHEDIFDAITSGQMYSVMDDQLRTVDLESRVVAELCSDTAVRSYVDDPRCPPTQTLTEYGFNITEDFHLDDVQEYTCSNGAWQRANSLAMKYMYTPLPRHLPTLNRDLLMLIAAYNGDIDRYVRLRRSKMRPLKEKFCVMRGIYHNTFFAKYWSLNVETDSALNRRQRDDITTAVYAREIMDNNITNVAKETDASRLPYCIWYPKMPCSTVLQRLAAIQPAMRPQIARACIVADEQRLYDELDPPWDIGLLKEAKHSSNQYYRQDLERKRPELEPNEPGCISTLDRPGEHKCLTVKDLLAQQQTSAYCLEDDIDSSAIEEHWARVNSGQNADIRNVEFRVSLTRDAMPTEDGRMSTTLSPTADAWLQEKGHLDMYLEDDLFFDRLIRFDNV